MYQIFQVIAASAAKLMMHKNSQYCSAGITHARTAWCGVGQDAHSAERHVHLQVSQKTKNSARIYTKFSIVVHFHSFCDYDKYCGKLLIPDIH